MDRRDFLKTAAGAGFSAGLAAAGLIKPAQSAEERMKEKKGIKKALILGMLPGNLSTADKFKLARDLGFDGIEVPPLGPNAVDDIRNASAASGLPVHSIIFGGWGKPLSSNDPAVRREGAKDVADGLKFARDVGADGLLLVPGIVNKQTRYIDAYEHSQREIKALIPVAEKYKVKINVEEVWNKFLLSPLEFSRYVDEFKSPWVKAYFDVANVIDFAWPEDWIRTLGKRIEKVHIKDFKRENRSWPALGEGDADFPTVMKAFHDVGYAGWFTCELPGGDEAYLRDVSNRMDRIIAGKDPAGKE